MTGTVIRDGHWRFPLEVSLPIVGDAHPLRVRYNQFLYRAITIALLVHLLLISSWILLRTVGRGLAPIEDPMVIEFMSPPSLKDAKTIGKASQTPWTPRIIEHGIPEPVVDHTAPFMTIGSQEDLSNSLESIDISSFDNGVGETGFLNIPEADTGLPSPVDFIPVEEPPVLISLTSPTYPEIARQAGVEGTVTLRVLVGKDGKVIDAIVTNGVPMLDEAALVAVRDAVFRPALQQHRPVAVWVMIPIRFLLD